MRSIQGQTNFQFRLLFSNIVDVKSTIPCKCLMNEHSLEVKLLVTQISILRVIFQLGKVNKSQCGVRTQVQGNCLFGHQYLTTTSIQPSVPKRLHF